MPGGVRSRAVAAKIDRGGERPSRASLSGFLWNVLSILVLFGTLVCQAQFVFAIARWDKRDEACDTERSFHYHAQQNL